MSFSTVQYCIPQTKSPRRLSIAIIAHNAARVPAETLVSVAIWRRNRLTRYGSTDKPR